MNNSIQKKLYNIINNILRINGKQVFDNLKLDDKLKDDLGMDSVEMVDLVVSIEDEFEVDIFESGSVDTVNDIFELIK
jgi:acyl carrier protein